jgi:RHS repeat-associated protein
MVAVNYLWNPLNDNIVREFDDAGAAVAEYATDPYTYGDLISQHRDGNSAFHSYDALGSTLALTNSAGTTTDIIAYTAFGEVTEHTGATDSPFQYVGRMGYYHDDCLEDTLVRRRVLRPMFARWTSKDPLVPHDTQTHPYLYARNRPSRFGDPSGTIDLLLDCPTAKSFPHGLFVLCAVKSTCTISCPGAALPKFSFTIVCVPGFLLPVFLLTLGSVAEFLCCKAAAKAPNIPIVLPPGLPRLPNLPTIVAETCFETALKIVLDIIPHYGFVGTCEIL